MRLRWKAWYGSFTERGVYDWGCFRFDFFLFLVNKYPNKLLKSLWVIANPKTVDCTQVEDCQGCLFKIYKGWWGVCMQFMKLSPDESSVTRHLGARPEIIATAISLDREDTRQVCNGHALNSHTDSRLCTYCQWLHIMWRRCVNVFCTVFTAATVAKSF